MTSESQEVAQRDEREFTASLEAHTPDWLPGIKLGLSFKRLWDQRPRKFVEAAAITAGIAVDDLAEALEGNEAAADIFATAARRAGERSDPMYRDVLGRLVGAALVDDSKIDEIGFVVDRLVTLDPVHVRLLSLLLFHSTEEAIAAGNPLAIKWRDRGGKTSLTLKSDSLTGSSPKVSHLAEVLGLSPAVARACIDDMEQVQFVKRAVSRNQDVILVTDLGLTAALILRDVLVDIQSTSDD